MLKKWFIRIQLSTLFFINIFCSEGKIIIPASKGAITEAVFIMQNKQNYINDLKNDVNRLIKNVDEQLKEKSYDLLGLNKQLEIRIRQLNRVITKQNNSKQRRKLCFIKQEIHNLESKINQLEYLTQQNKYLEEVQDKLNKDIKNITDQIQIDIKKSTDNEISNDDLKKFVKFSDSSLDKIKNDTRIILVNAEINKKEYLIRKNQGILDSRTELKNITSCYNKSRLRKINNDIKYAKTQINRFTKSVAKLKKDLIDTENQDNKLA